MEETQSLNLEIRSVTSDDFDRLTYINRVCFPGQLRWRLPKSHVRKWWILLTNSKHCKLWACESCGKVIAYIALVFDRYWYEDAWERQRFSFYEMLYIFVTCPKFFVKRALTKIKQKRRKKTNIPVDTSKENQEISLIKKIFAENTPWCGPYAVNPSAQGKGVATKLVHLCFKRASYLGFTEMYACLQKKNFKSKNLLEKLGFVKFDEIDNTLFCKKSLSKGEI